jgi:hypothetical protein
VRGSAARPVGSGVAGGELVEVEPCQPARNRVLRLSITYRIIQALRLQMKRGKVRSEGERAGVRLWALRLTPTDHSLEDLGHCMERSLDSKPTLIVPNCVWSQPLVHIGTWNSKPRPGGRG